MKSILFKIAKVLVVVEIVYLVIVNLALNLPATQTLINKIKPEKFNITWESAWTWYPFRLQAQGISVNGQSRSQQWKVDLPIASGSIALLPLILRKVRIYDVQGENANYAQRPRLKPDKDYTDVLEYFPAIAGRKIAEADTSPRKKRKSWDIEIADIQASGSHTFWIFQYAGTVSGEFSTNLGFQTRGGPFHLANGMADLRLDSLLVNGNQEIVRGALFKGSFEILPVVFRENKGTKALPYIIVDADIEADMDSLAFLNLYLADFHGMRVDGVGRIAGRLRFDKGSLLGGTGLAVAARRLTLDMMSHRAQGSGSIYLKVSSEEADALDVAINFSELSAFHEASQTALFSGKGLAISGRGKTTMPLLRGDKSRLSKFNLTIPVVHVPDMAAYQRYIPKKWGLKLYGGEGSLHAQAELLETSFGADLSLHSADADVGIDEYRFRTDLELQLKLDNPSFADTQVDVSGTYIKLGDSSVASENKGKSAPIQADLNIRKGILKLNLPETANTDTNLQVLSDALSSYNLKTLLAAADADLEVDGSISELGWINVLLKNSSDLAIAGNGLLKINAILESGWPAVGTQAEILPENLTVGFLDYLIDGEGKASLAVEDGGESPDVSLEVRISNGQLKRVDEAQPFVEDVEIKVDALGRNLSYRGPSEDLQLHVQIPSAKVQDMSVFNSYFPADSPVQLLQGTADLQADIQLRPKTAGGFLRLHTQQLKGRVDVQEISADLALDLKLSDGVPKNREFHLSGSTLRLDQVKVTGQQTKFEQQDWNVLLNLNEGRVVWKKPLQLQFEADVEMQDSRPVVALLANHREKHGWLEKLLTVRDVQGTLSMDMLGKQILVPHAFVSSDKIDLGAKAMINAQNRHGVVYARYKKLHGLLKIRDGKRNFDIIRARKKFDEYVPGVAGKPTPKTGRKRASP